MAFNQKVEEVQREHEREMAAVQSRRKRIVAHADVLQQEMLAAFEGLESLIQSGRAQITSEHSRQLKVRAENSSALVVALDDLAKRHSSEIDRRLEEEQRQVHHHHHHRQHHRHH